MTEQLISPAVFTYENDVSFLPAGITAIGAAFVGPTVKGEAFVPTEVTSYPDFEKKFGPADGNSYLPYAVESYLNDAGSATITRILGTEGYLHTAVAGIVLSGSSGNTLIGVIHHSNKNYLYNYSTSAVSIATASAAQFNLSGAGFYQAVTASFKSTDTSYIGKQFGRTPVTTTNDGYLYTYFQNAADAIISASGVNPATSTISIVKTESLDFSDTSSSYAVTPMIQSQPVNGTAINLFEIYTLSQGEYNNRDIKISIYNIKRAEEITSSTYGAFSIAVRKIDDTDKNPVVLETFPDVNLNPASDNYICKVIGDKFNQYVYDTVTGGGQVISKGDYENKSKYIRINVTDDVTNSSISPTLVPFGFAAVKQPVQIGSYFMPTASMVTNQLYPYHGTTPLYNSKIYYGFDFDSIYTDNYEYLMPIDGAAITGSNVPFNLASYNVNTSAVAGGGQNIYSGSGVPSTARKFSVPFQGGFGGMDPAIPKNMGLNITSTNTMGFDLSATGSGSVAYKQAIDILSNSDLYDFNLLFLPGVIHEYHDTITNYAMEMVEDRGGDAFCVIDGHKMDRTNSNEIVAIFEDTDTSYGGTFTPWLKIPDTTNNKLITVPPSTIMAGVFAYSDKVGGEWYAPAGFNRGVMKNVKDVYIPITKPNRDILYAGKVNAIAKFPKEGIVVLGQKTLQTASSALDRISVRRLLIKVKKYIASSGKYLLFENNTDRVRTQFENIVTPYLNDIQTKEGLYLFKVVCDETNNTNDTIDRHELNGQIWLQPAISIELIKIGFTVTNTGASFSIV